MIHSGDGWMEGGRDDGRDRWVPGRMELGRWGLRDERRTQRGGYREIGKRGDRKGGRSRDK